MLSHAKRGMNTLILSPQIDDRDGPGVIKSRIGIEAEAISLAPEDDVLLIVRRHTLTQPVHCVLIDEAQFLTKKQVYELGEVCDRLNIPVLAYGLRTDFQGELFEGSRYLLGWADNLKEIKTVCHCGKKATMVIRMNEDGEPLHEGEQVEIGGNDRYVSMCRHHYKETLGM